MMTWNYRIVEKTDKETGYTWQGIFEVYYTDGEPTAVTQEAVSLVWEVGDNTHYVLSQLEQAFKQPVLYWDDFNNKEVF